MKALLRTAAGQIELQGRRLARSAALIAMLALLPGAMPHPAYAQAAGAAAWNTVLAGAKREGKVVLYSAQPVPLIARITEAFKRAHPDIAIEYVRGTSGQMVAKIDQERAANVDGADVFITSETAWFVARAKDGGLQKPSGPAMAAWPAAYLREGQVPIAGLEPFVIPYNKTLVTSPPRGYADLLRPEFAGKLSTSELNATGNIAWSDWLEKTQGADFLVKLRAQNPKLHAGSVPAAQSVVAGEVLVSALGLPSSAKPMIDQGAPLAYVVPNPSFGVEYPIGAFAWSRRPNAALVLVNFLMSREGQATWHGQGETASPLADIPGSLRASTIVPYDSTAYTPEVVAKYRDKWNKIFK